MSEAPPHLPRRRLIGRVAALGLAYFGAAAITVGLTRFGGGVAFIWTGTALLLAVLLIADRRDWIAYAGACLAASFAATWAFGLGAAAAGPLSFINVGEALLGAWAIRRWRPACRELESLEQIGQFLLIAGAGVPALSAFAGAAVASGVTGVPYAANWLDWFTGHALGTITVTPVLLLALGGDGAERGDEVTPRRRVETIVLLSILAAVSALVFGQATVPMLFFPFLPLMINVFRLGRLGAASSALILTIVASYYTLRGIGPIAAIGVGAGVRAHYLLCYLATAVLMALPAAGDLLRRQRMFRQLQQQGALHKLILDHTGDIIMTVKVDGRIRYISPSVERIMGRAPAALVGATPQSFVHADDAAAVIRVHGQALREPDRTFTVEYRLVADDRTLGWFESHTRATVDGDGRASGVVSIIRDVSQRKAVEAVLERGAHTDALTGLANRRALDRAMASRADAADAARPAALAIFDLDHFKRINDRFGHAAGDAALRAFADLLRRTVRDGDLVARVGGEEFVAVLDGADLEQARSVCERVRRGMAETEIAAADGAIFRVTVSAGLCVIPPGLPGEQVIAAADAALYRAKADGRNRLSLAA